MSITNAIGYLSKFDNTGKIKGSEPLGMSVPESEQAKYEADGYIQISVEDWNTYMGNNGWGDNGTGYIRDPKTGKPVSAPPAPPIEAEPQEPPVDEERLAAFEAMAAQEARLVAYGDRIAALEAALKTKGGEGK